MSKKQKAKLPGMRRTRKAKRAMRFAKARIPKAYRKTIRSKKHGLKFQVLGAYKPRKKVRYPTSLAGYGGKRGSVVYKARVWRKGKKGSQVVRFTNPAGVTGAVRGYFKSIMDIPSVLMSRFQGKNVLKNVGYLAAGTAATYFGSGFLVNMVANGVERILPASMGEGTKQVIRTTVGVAMPYTIGYVASRFVRSQDMKVALIAGGAAASVLTLIAPNFIPNTLARFGLGAYGTDMLAGYVAAPSYQGVGGYVAAPSYQGVGGYVAAPSYQGVGGAQDMLAGADDMLAGVDGYLDSNYLGRSYLNSGAAVEV